jgi:transposase InsO family protein
VKGKAEQWYRKKGMIHQLTTPYTPELNGTIERFMRTAKGMISAMIVGAGLGHGYWDYAARYAAVTIMKISKQGRNLSLEETHWKAIKFAIDATVWKLMLCSYSEGNTIKSKL